MSGTPLLFSPLTLRGLTLQNRIVMSPMCQYRAGDDGHATAWHRVHYGARAVGRVGLMILEATAVVPEGRITVHDLGLWEDSQVESLKMIVDFAHDLGVPVGIQLGHAGRKAELPAPVGPSPLPFSPEHPTPRELTTQEISGVVEAFALAARRAVRAGFDMVEVHGAHGYLLHEFLSPLSNHRQDEYGSTTDGRCRLLGEVLNAVRSELSPAMPLSLRISASDWTESGLAPEDFRPLLLRIAATGVDILDVSSGGLLPAAPPAVYPGYQLPLAEELAFPGLTTMSVGLLADFSLAENALRKGTAQLIAVGRELLRDPYWPLRTALAHGVDMVPPAPYGRAF